MPLINHQSISSHLAKFVPGGFLLRSFKKASHLLYHSFNPPTKLSLSGLVSSFINAFNSFPASVLGFLVRYLLYDSCLMKLTHLSGYIGE